jgi:hypothetical protein
MKGIESVVLRGFRGVREGTVDGFADVSLLVGRNNSGKSTVAEAITRTGALVSLHSASVHSADVLGRDRMEYWQAVRVDPELWHIDLAYGARPPATVTAEVNGTGWGWVLRIVWEQAEIPQDVSKEVTGADSKDFARNITVFRPCDLSARRVENMLWPRLLADRRDKVLIKALNDIFGTNIEQIQLLPDKRFMLLLPNGALSLDAYGDGTRAAARCLMTLTAMQGTLFILEEPECHQHAGSLERFAAALCRLAKTQDVQLVLTTHSAECVRAFMRGSEAAGSSFSLIHLKLEDGLLESRHFDRSAVDTLVASGLDVRFLDLYA